MKTNWLLMSVFALSLLTGCEIVLVDALPSDRDRVRGLEIYDARYTTNYRDRDGRNYICDNLTTPLTYEFEYDGDLDSWRLRLEGSRGDQLESEKLTPDSRSVEVSERGYIRDRYTIGPRVAPLALPEDAGLSPQGIVVVFEPDIIGESKLYLTVEDDAGRRTEFESRWLPIADNCP